MKRTATKDLKNFSLRLEPELVKKARQVAALLHCPPSIVMRTACRLGLDLAEQQLNLGGKLK